MLGTVIYKSDPNMMLKHSHTTFGIVSALEYELTFKSQYFYIFIIERLPFLLLHLLEIAL